MDIDFEAGTFLVDKPQGASSFYIVRKVRKALGMKKVGHAGTLDPFATGLLVVCAGRSATKMIGQIMEGDKEYITTLRLGVETSTLDPEGEVTATHSVGSLSENVIEKCLEQFRGEQLQIPPIYSALKHKGKPLYYYARKGIAVEKPPRSVTIHTLERIDGGLEVSDDSPYLTLRVVCTKGTYIRTLGADIGKILGCGAYLTTLRRMRSGCFHVRDSIAGEDLLKEDAKIRLMNKVLSVSDVCNLLQ
ncbi:tRNA pseudouridine synthase B [Desulfocapsa sulfexigens DSM 10523]|uniref:tRNA pseudouridine synthase B n=1 Tax=Desulfocapsa sulfexigens (strain DSM 10523 / SB164P1) TaxID=1167006 RepID=M1P4I1_DESSD|nr:tRNA pseudouridine(55) synthase TruB [Desulfocapsa sulfexigens]AGF76602.1 tRNA pseudouridine synthase B [Desulfocapsa sulfexigens DSM 10523]